MGILPKIFGRSTFSRKGDPIQILPDRPVASGLEFSLSLELMFPSTMARHLSTYLKMKINFNKLLTYKFYVTQPKFQDNIFFEDPGSTILWVLLFIPKQTKLFNIIKG